MRREGQGMQDKMGTVACRINTVRTACLFPPFFIHSRNIVCFPFFVCWINSLFTCVSFSCSFVIVSTVKSSVVLSDTFRVWFERMFLESIRFAPHFWSGARWWDTLSTAVDLFCELLKACSCASFIRKSCHFLSTFESFWFCFWKTLIEWKIWNYFLLDARSYWKSKSGLLCWSVGLFEALSELVLIKWSVKYLF